MSEITRVLSQVEAGKTYASAELLPLVYDELRKLAVSRMASERSDHTLQPTALVHEAYLRLIGGEQAKQWDNRGHFYAAAAEAMRRILIESARRKATSKRGGDCQRVELQSDIAATVAAAPEHLLAVSEALDLLAEEEPQAAELVKLRVFAGFSITEAGEILAISRRQAYETWEFAEAWFSAWFDPAD